MNRLTLYLMIILAAGLVIGCSAIGRTFGRDSEGVATETASNAERGGEIKGGTKDTVEAKTHPSEAHSAGGIALLLGFSWSDDPASGDLERAFSFGLAHAGYSAPLSVMRTGSPFETARACDSLMNSGGPLLIIFAGDEGSAAVVTLMSAEFRSPVLKITGDNRSYTAFSPYIYEFLPSGRTQTLVLGEFAANELGISHFMMLNANDARGRALGEGFRVGAESVEVEHCYDANTSSIRSDVARVFNDSTRTSRGGAEIETALSPEERARMFGDANSGDVLIAHSEEDPDSTAESLQHEGFFFAVSPDHVGIFAEQLPDLPPETQLLGNSSWVDLDILTRNQRVTDGMYITAPLLPCGADSSQVLAQFEADFVRTANAWELLGLDAGAFVAAVMQNAPRRRSDVANAVENATPFYGVAVNVSFSGSSENQDARVLRFEHGELQVIR